MYPTGKTERQSIKERTLAAQGRGKTSTPFIKLDLDGQEIVVDPNDLTIRERHEGRAELRRLGLTDDDGGYDWQTGAAMTAWLIARRTNPDLTLGEVVDTVKVGDLTFDEDVSTPDSISPDDSPQ